MIFDVIQLQQKISQSIIEVVELDNKSEATGKFKNLVKIIRSLQCKKKIDQVNEYLKKEKKQEESSDDDSEEDEAT